MSELKPCPFCGNEPTIRIFKEQTCNFLQPESEYVFYDSDHGFCINTQDVLDYLRKELRNG